MSVPLRPRRFAEIQAGLIETGLVFQYYEDAGLLGGLNSRKLRDALRVIHEGDGETVFRRH